MAMNDLLTDRVTIRRAVAGAPSTTGVETDEPTDVATDVPASVQPRNALFRQLAGGQTDVAMYVGYFDPATDIKIDDQVVVANGTVYEVTFVKNLRGHHIEADLKTFDQL